MRKPGKSQTVKETKLNLTESLFIGKAEAFDCIKSPDNSLHVNSGAVRKSNKGIFLSKSLQASVCYVLQLMQQNFAFIIAVALVIEEDVS